MQLYLSRKKCYSENNTDTKAERGAKSIRRKKGGNKMEFVFEHATMIAVIAVVVIILAILASGYVKARRIPHLLFPVSKRPADPDR